MNTRHFNPRAIGPRTGGIMTAIEWTHMPGYRGETWNPVTGCTKVSAGCKYCYAERNFPRPYARTGRKFTDIATYPERLDRPLRATLAGMANFSGRAQLTGRTESPG